MRLAASLALALVCAAVATAACDDSGTGPLAPNAGGADTGDFPSSLATYAMVTVAGGAVVPNAGVTPYDLNTPLFSDYAVKYRTVWMPPGASAAYQDTDRLDLPVGTVLTKSFGFPADFRVQGAPVKWVETRVLVHAARGWKGTSYVWDDAQQTATVSAGGEVVSISFVDASGQTQSPSYLVPSQSECKKCHANDGTMIPLGPRADQLNRTFAYADGPENESYAGASSGCSPARRRPIRRRACPSSTTRRPATSRRARARTCRPTARIATTGRARRARRASSSSGA